MILEIALLVAILGTLTTAFLVPVASPFLKKKIGLFDRPIKDPQNINMVGSKKHRDLARESVRKSMVLLKNKNKLLPIDRSGKKISFVGEHADNIGYQCGGWTITWQGGSGDITPGTSILDAFKATVKDTNDISYSIYGENIPDSDIIIAVIGEKPYSEGWGDRKSLDLSKENKKILKRVKEKNLPYLIILVSGRPMLIEDEIKDCDAFIAVWLPGTEGAGIADVIFGDYPPTGKLSMSWPRSMDQLPINIGDKIYNPLFPFGYGLSY